MKNEKTARVSNKLARKRKLEEDAQSLESDSSPRKRYVVTNQMYLAKILQNKFSFFL